MQMRVDHSTRIEGAHPQSHVHRTGSSINHGTAAERLAISHIGRFQPNFLCTKYMMHMFFLPTVACRNCIRASSKHVGCVEKYAGAKHFASVQPQPKTCKPGTYFMSRQFAPDFKSATSGTASSCTFSMALRTSGRRRSISLCGASNSSSSCTCK